MKAPAFIWERIEGILICVCDQLVEVEDCSYPAYVKCYKCGAEYMLHEGKIDEWMPAKPR